MTYSVSASQIDTFGPVDGPKADHQCERRWAFDRDRKHTQDLYAWRGEVGHSMLEAWGKDWTPPETAIEARTNEALVKYGTELDGKLADAKQKWGETATLPEYARAFVTRIADTANKMVPLLPSPPWPAIESAFEVTIEGVLWRGRLDLETEDTVFDHKFTGSPEHAKTVEDLLTDPQALAYAHKKVLAQGLSRVNLQWTYGQIGKRAAAWPVRRTLWRGEIEGQIQPHIATSKRLIHLRTIQADPLTLEPNFRACSAFNGCPHESRCQPTPEQLIAAFFKETLPTDTGDKNTMGLLDQISGNTAAPAPGPSTAPAPNQDFANVVARVTSEAKSLLGLGLARAEVVSVLAGRYVGIPKAAVEAAVPDPERDAARAKAQAEEEAKAKQEAEAQQARLTAEIRQLRGETAGAAGAAGNGSAVNPEPLPNPPPPVETDRKKGEPETANPKKLARSAKAPSAPTDETAAALYELIREISAVAKSSTSAPLGERAEAALRLVQAFKALQS